MVAQVGCLLLLKLVTDAMELVVEVIDLLDLFGA